jgi:hypothetical protein
MPAFRKELNVSPTSIRREGGFKRLHNYPRSIFDKLIKVRPAGLEPATPCLEGGSEQIIKITKFHRQYRTFIF